MKKLLVILLLVALTVSIAACSPTQGDPTTTQTGNTDNTNGSELPASYVSPERIKVTYMIQEHPSTPFNKDWVIWKNLTEATNVEFEFMPASGDAFFAETKNALFNQ